MKLNLSLTLEPACLKERVGRFELSNKSIPFLFTQFIVCPPIHSWFSRLKVHRTFTLRGRSFIIHRFYATGFPPSRISCHFCNCSHFPSAANCAWSPQVVGSCEANLAPASLNISLTLSLSVPAN